MALQYEIEQNNENFGNTVDIDWTEMYSVEYLIRLLFLKPLDITSECQRFICKLVTFLAKNIQRYSMVMCCMESGKVKLKK